MNKSGNRIYRRWIRRCCIW